MIGNDLICLSSWSNRSNKRHERYLKKTFTPKERAILAEARFSYEDALLWSAKEAAFKLYMQLYPSKDRFYAPKVFEVFLNQHTVTQASGHVKAYDQYFPFRSQINQDYLFTQACLEEARLSAIQFEIYEREPGKERLMNHPTHGQLRFVNNTRGIPEPFNQAGDKVGSASVSHDGKWEGLSFLSGN